MRCARVIALGSIVLLAGCGPDTNGPAAPSQAVPTVERSELRASESGIRIIADVQPDGPTDLSFSATGRRVDDFVLDDDSDPTLPNFITFARVRPGAYEVQLQDAGGYALVAINCTSAPNGGAGINNNTIDVPSRYARIQLEKFELVTCTFVFAMAT